MKSSQRFVVVALNVILTIVTASIVGPSATKLERNFGLVTWAARTPFYLLPIYLSPLGLLLKPNLLLGIVIGVSMGVPLALWARATACPLPVQLTYIASGILQGALLSWLISRWHR